MSIKAKMHELKKELLLKEASTQFEEIGYEYMKVADLAKAAGVSIGTIYTLFGSKEGLYLAYIEYQINTFFEELQKNTISDKDAKQRIYTFIELKFFYYQQKRKAIEQSASNNKVQVIIHSSLIPCIVNIQTLFKRFTNIYQSVL
jgi:AcrR family transcriptional regulator